MSDCLVEAVKRAISEAWPSDGYESLLDAQAKAAIAKVREYDKR